MSTNKLFGVVPRHLVEGLARFRPDPADGRAPASMMDALYLASSSPPSAGAAASSSVENSSEAPSAVRLSSGAGAVEAPPPARRPELSTGRWTKEEHEEFLRCLNIYGREWKKVSELITTRTAAQIRSHAQKYFKKIAGGKGDDEGGERGPSGEAPPPPVAAAVAADGVGPQNAALTPAPPGGDGATKALRDSPISVSSALGAIEDMLLALRKKRAALRDVAPVEGAARNVPRATPDSSLAASPAPSSASDDEGASLSIENVAPEAASCVDEDLATAVSCESSEPRSEREPSPKPSFRVIDEGSAASRAPVFAADEAPAVGDAAAPALARKRPRDRRDDDDDDDDDDYGAPDDKSIRRRVTCEDLQGLEHRELIALEMLCSRSSLSMQRADRPPAPRTTASR